MHLAVKFEILVPPIYGNDGSTTLKVSGRLKRYRLVCTPEACTDEDILSIYGCDGLFQLAVASYSESHISHEEHSAFVTPKASSCAAQEATLLYNLSSNA